MIPRPRNVLASAPDREALLEAATAIYISAFASGVGTALLNQGVPPMIAEQTARSTAQALMADPLSHAGLADGITAVLSGVQPGNSHYQRVPR